MSSDGTKRLVRKIQDATGCKYMVGLNTLNNLRDAITTQKAKELSTSWNDIAVRLVVAHLKQNPPDQDAHYDHLSTILKER